MTNHKDSRPHSSPAAELFARKGAGSGPHPLHALDHLAFALIVDAGVAPGEALAALHRLRGDFIDWNEIRVARVQEVARSLKAGPEGERAAMRIKEEYNAFFDKKGALDFEFLAIGKPAETKRLLGQLLPRLYKSAVALLLYEFCLGASIPLSDGALKQARKDGIVGKTGDRNQVARALADGLTRDQAARLVQYWELEAQGVPYAEMPKREPAKGKKSAAKAKAAKKKNA